ncbi:hemagglutinin repeat-containing protein [Granulibacter bethesdensis]|uniref:hemagglutinin repeat-containing protein n=1 Tax=Granulibacter bethesdensis TaxID=364410 RepID=UPI00090AEAA1|nr:hemagglutinin repeat-containing protein [Granulibacter bethesdensis]APG31156.1 Hemolysin [Granulibacter bethesdensis CGDNIH4]
MGLRVSGWSKILMNNRHIRKTGDKMNFSFFVPLSILTELSSHAAGIGRRFIAFCLSIALVLEPVMADAQRIVVDAGAGGALPTLDTTANGVAQLNVATPNAAGLSHNHFTEFGVAPSGLILNNATTATSTQLGGIVYGNSNLQGRSAKIILNEVTGNAASQLNGFTEVAGASAAVVLANPNGITCSGCGFINTPRVTLSTGTPSLGADGSLKDLSVREGTIAFVGKGGNFTEVPVLDIVSRRVTVNGPVHGQAILLTAGQVNYAYPSGTATAASDGSLAPQFAIDTAAMGGMYANRILMTVTEAGAGVRIDGKMAANASDLILTANGQLVLKGSLSAAGNIAISTQGIDASPAASIQSGGNVQLNQNGLLNNAGLIASTKESVSIEATSFNNNGTVQSYKKANFQVAQKASNVSGGKIITNAGDLVFSVGSLSNAGTIVSGSGSLQVQSKGDVSNNGGVLAADTGLTGHINGVLDNTGGQLASASGAVILDGGSNNLPLTAVVNTNGLIQARNGDIRLETQSYADAGKGIATASGWMALLSTEAVSIQGQVIGGSGLVLSAGGPLLNAGMLGAQAGSVTIKSGDIMNTGKIDAASDKLAIAASSLGNAGKISAAGTTIVDVKGALNNSGYIESGSDLHIAANALASNGSIISNNGFLNIKSSSSSSNAGGILRGQAGVSLRSSDTFDNTNGQIVAVSDRLLLNVAGLLNNSNGIIKADAGAISLTALSLANSGQIESSDGQTLMLSGLLSNKSSGLIRSQKEALSVSAGSVNNAGQVTAPNSLLTLYTSGTFNNAGGGLNGQTGVTLKSGGDFNNTGGKLEAKSGDVSVHASSYTDGGSGLITGSGQVSLDTVAGFSVGVKGEITGDTGLQLTAGGALSNNGVIGSHSGSVKIIAGASVNNGQIASAAGTISLTALSLVNSGQVESSDGQTLMLSGLLNNESSGLIRSQKEALSVSAGSVNNAGQVIAPNSLLTLYTSGTFNNAGGTLGGQTGVALNSGGDFNNTGGKLEAKSGNVSVHASSYTDVGGGLLSGSGQVSLDAVAGFSVGAKGEITGGTGLQLTAGGALNNNGMIGARAGNVSFSIGKTVTNTGSVIAETGLLGLTADALRNSGKLSGAQGDIFQIAGVLDNTNGLVIAEHGNILIGGMHSGSATAQIINNGVGIVEGVPTGGVIAARQGTLTLNTGTFVGNGALFSAQDMALFVSGDITNAGQIAAGPLTLRAGGILKNEGIIEADSGNLIVSAASLINHGTIGTQSGKFDLKSGAIMNKGIMIAVSNDVSLNAQSLLNSGQIAAGKAADISVADKIENAGSGQIAALGGNLQFNAASLSNTATGNSTGLLSTGLIIGKIAGNISNTGMIYGVSGVTLSIGGTLDNSNGSVTAQAGNVLLKSLTGSVAPAILNNGGQIQASDGDINIAAASYSDNASSIVSAKHTLDLSVSGLVSVQGNVSGGTFALSAGEIINSGMVGALQGSVTIWAGNITNDGLVQAAAGDITLQATALANKGQIVASGQQVLTVSNMLSNTGSGLISAKGGNLTISAGTFNNTAGIVKETPSGLAALGILSSMVKGDATNSGLFYGQSGVLFGAGGTLHNDGGIVASDKGDITLRGLAGNTGMAAITNNGGSIQANAGAVSIITGSYSADSAGQISAGTALSMNADGPVVTAGPLAGGSNGLTLNTSGRLTIMTGATIGAASGLVSLIARDLDNQGSLVAKNGSLNLVASGSLNNNSSITASGIVNLDIGGLFSNNASGTIGSVSDTVTVHAGIFNNSGALSSGTELFITDSDNVTNTGTILGKTGLVMNVAGIVENKGIIGATTGDIWLAGIGNAAMGGLINSAGNIQANAGNITINTGSYYDEGLGQVRSSQSVALLTEKSVSIGADGALVGGQNLLITAGDSVVNGGLIGAKDGSVSVTANGAVVNNKNIQSEGTSKMMLEAASLNNNGSIISSSGGSVQVSGKLNNSKEANLVVVQSDLTISAGSLVNNGSMGAGGVLNATLSEDLSNSGMMVGKTGATVQIDGTLSNAGGSIIALAGSLTIKGLLNFSIGLLSNANGSIQAGDGDLIINAAAQSGLGKISAANNLFLNLKGDFKAEDFAGVASGKDISLDVDGALSISSGQSIGANAQLSISANSLINAGGLFGTTDMNLLIKGDISNTGLIYGSTGLNIGLDGTLSNNQGALIAENGNLTIGGRNAGSSASALLNHSGLIQAASSNGNVTIDAQSITNDVAGGVTQTSGIIFQKLYAANQTPPAVDLSNFKSSSDISQYWTNVKHVYVPNPIGAGGVWFALYDQSAQSGILVEGTGASYVRNAAAALISAGGNLTINSSNGITNDASHLSAGGDINLTGGSLNNIGYQGSVKYTTTCTGNDSCRSALPLVDPLPSNIPMPGWVIGAGHPVVAADWFNAAGQSVTGSIIAGGNISGDFTGTITNETKIAQAMPSQMLGFGGSIPLPSTAAAPVGSNGAGSFISNGNGGLGSMATLPGGLSSTTGGLPSGTVSYTVPGASNSLTPTQGGGGVSTGNLSMQGAGSVGGTASYLPGINQGAGSWGSNGNAVVIKQGASSSAVTPQFQPVSTANTASSSSATQSSFSSVDGPSTAQIIASVAGGNALFVPNPSPQAQYLIETNPNYSTFKGFYGSQYLLDRLGVNSQTTPPFLGDAYFDTRYIAQQVSDATGRATLSAAYSTQQAQMVALLNNAASQSHSLGLQFGVDLTPEQVAALDDDIVWYVPRTVNGKIVLVPQLYLASASRDKVLTDGAVLAGKDVTLKAAGLYNSGTVSASNNLLISVTGDIINNGGTLKAGNDILLQAGGTILSTSTTQSWQTMGGSIESLNRVASIVSGGNLTMKAGQDIVSAGSVFGAGGSLELSAGRNVALGSLALSTKDDSSFGGVNRQFNLTENLGTTLSAGKNSIISAKNSLSLTGVKLSSGGDVTLIGGQSLSLGASTNTLSSTISGSESGFGNSSGFTGLHDVTLQIGSSINAGGNMTLAAGDGGITLNGSSVKAGGALDAITTGSITLNAVTSSETREASSSHTGLLDGRSQTVGSYDEHVQGSTLSGGSGLSLLAVGSITGTGANLLSDHGPVSLQTKNGDISLLSATEHHDSFASYSESGVSFGSSGIDHHHNTMSTQTEAVLSVGSTVSGDTVSIQSGKNLTIVGSGVVGTGNVTLGAVGDISIRSAEQTLSITDNQNEKKAGVFSMGNSMLPVGVGVGLQQNSNTTTIKQVTNVASTVGSLSGDLTVHSGGAVTLQDAHLSSGGDMAIIGKSVTFDVSHDTTTQTQTQKSNFSGLTASLSGVVGNAYTAAAVAASDRPSDARLQALEAGQAGYASYEAYKAVDAATSSGGNGQLLQVDVMVGSSGSKANDRYFSSTAQGSVAVAGGNLSVVSTDGDITARGATMKAGGNAAFVSTGNIIFQSGENSTQYSNDNVSKSAAVGVYAGIGTQSTGYGVDGSASWSQGGTVASSTTPVNTVVAAGNTLVLVSGKDTKLEGADASANKIVASIGGDLILKSMQATASGNSSQAGGSVNVQIGITGTSGGSASVAASNINNGYASVVSQTGLFAGKGGLNVTVGGNTSLTGAVISSLAPANDNTLNTGTLTVSNLDNHRDNSAVSMTASASSSGTGSGGGVAQTSDSAHSTTLSAITSNVGVTVRNGSVPSNLLRPDQLTANTSLGTVTGGIAGNGGTALQTTNGLQNKFDPQQTRNDLAVQNGFTQLGMMVSGEVAKSYRDKADRDVQAASEKLEKDRRNGADSSTLAADESDLKNKQATADFWSGYGSGLMHMVAAGTGAALGGGNVAGAMAGSAAGDAASGALSGFTGQVTADLPAWLRPIATNIVTSTVSGVAGGIAGSAVGGSGGTLSGAGAAMSADEFNKQMHQAQKDRIRELANGDSEKEASLMAAACAMISCYTEYPEGSEDYNYWKQESDKALSDKDFTKTRDFLLTQTEPTLVIMSTGAVVEVNAPLFGYSPEDAVVDALSSARGSGALQAGGGIAGMVTAGAAAVAAASCTAAAAACIALGLGAALVGTISTDQTAAGITTTATGQQTYSLGAQALSSATGMSQDTAEMLYGIAEAVGPAAVGKVTGTLIGKDGEMIVVSQTNATRAAYAGSSADALRLRTQLAFQEAGILDANGELTSEAIKDSKVISLSGTTINNPIIVKELTKDGSDISEWGKYTTKSVIMPNGQSLQIHFYMNSTTGKIDNVTKDFKVKGIVRP